MGVNGLIKKVLKETGLNPERFSLQWASAAEAPRFVKLITDFTQKIKELGPLGRDEGLSPEEVQERLLKAEKLMSNKKLRMSFGNVAKALRKEGTSLTDEIIAAKVDEKLTKAVSAGLG